MSQPFRLLLIEDDKVRIEKFREWVPKNTILVVATSAGQAIGLLRRIAPGDYGGLLLDHDLQQQAVTGADTGLSGSDLIEIITQTVERKISILIHSQNPNGAASMTGRLSEAGFWVTRVPWNLLTKERFCEWVEDVRSEWLE